VQKSGLHLLTNKGNHLAPRLYVPHIVHELPSLVLSGMSPALPFINVWLARSQSPTIDSKKPQMGFGGNNPFPSAL
jgi:hypothetical protein